MKRITLIVLTAFIVISCDPINSGQVAERQQILFEVEYENYAWGHQHHGIYINNEGEVFQYNYDQNDTIWQDNQDGFYTEKELLEKFQPNKQVVDTLDRSTVMDKQQLIPLLMNAGYSDTTSAGADQGAMRYIAYQYITYTNQYRQIVLEQDGDWEYKLTSSEADELTDWLKGLQVD